MPPDDAAPAALAATDAAPVGHNRDDQLRATALMQAVNSSRNDDSPDRVARRAQTYYAFLKGETAA